MASKVLPLVIIDILSVKEFTSDKLFVDTTLRLTSKKIKGASKYNEEAITNVGGFGEDRGEVRCLAALHIAHHEAARLALLSEPWACQPLDDAITPLVEDGDAPWRPAGNVTQIPGVRVPVVMIEGRIVRVVPERMFLIYLVKLTRVLVPGEVDVQPWRDFRSYAHEPVVGSRR